MCLGFRFNSDGWDHWAMWKLCVGIFVEVVGRVNSFTVTTDTIDRL